MTQSTPTRLPHRMDGRYAAIKYPIFLLLYLLSGFLLRLALNITFGNAVSYILWTMACLSVSFIAGITIAELDLARRTRKSNEQTP